MSEIMIGTYGYDRAEWNAAYYPEMLPPEWRFCFFSNQFRAVLLPAEVLRDADHATVAQWREDSDPEFRFVLEVGAAPALGVERLIQTLQPLRAQIAGWMLRHDAATFDTIAPMLSRTALPIAVDAPAALFASLCVAFPALALTRVWHPGQEPAISQSGLTLALVDRIDARSLRAVLEHLKTCAAQGGAAGLFFLPSAQAPQRAYEARVLAELMG